MAAVTSRASAVPGVVALVVVLALITTAVVIVTGDENRDTRGRPAQADAAPPPATTVLPEAEDEASFAAFAAEEPVVVPSELAADGAVDDVPPIDGLRRRYFVLSHWDAPLGASDPAPCTLIVVDARDQPVPGARVQVWGEGGTRTSEGKVQVTPGAPIGPIRYVTDGSGRCVVQPLRHHPRVFVEAAGVGTSGWVPLRSRSGQTRELLIPLVPGATVTGLVLAPTGAPAAGATVTITEPTVTGAQPRSAGSLLTDAEGRFEATIDGCGQHSFSARLGDLESRPQRLDAVRSAVHEIVLRLPGDWVVRGVLLDPDGAPVAKAAVRLEPELSAASEGGRSRPTRLHAQTDAQGRFELPIDVPVAGRLTGSLGAWEVARPPRVRVDAAHPVVEVTLRLGASAWIAGRVEGFDAELLRGSEVRAYAVPREKHQAFKETVLAADGSFRLGPLRDGGRYDVQAFLGADEARVAVVVHDVRAGTTGLVVTPDAEPVRAASIEMLVLSVATGLPVPRFSVTDVLRKPDGTWGTQWFQPVRDELGLCTLDELLPDEEHCLLVKADGLAWVLVESVRAAEEGATL
jgi:hypothetical protein